MDQNVVACGRSTDRLAGRHHRTLRLVATICLTASITIPTSATAQERSAPPQPYGDVLKCRDIPDDSRRLACFDSSVAALDKAEKQDEIAIVDHAQVQEAKRAVFGFALPKIRLFKHRASNDADEEITSIDSTVASTGHVGDGSLLFTIADGSQWQQVDTRPNFGVKRGMNVTIKKGAFGSYFAIFKGAADLRVKREN